MWLFWVWTWVWTWFWTWVWTWIWTRIWIWIRIWIRIWIWIWIRIRIWIRIWWRWWCCCIPWWRWWCCCILWRWRFLLLLSSSEAPTKVHILLLNICMCHRLSDIPCHCSLSFIVHMHFIYHFESFDLETNRFIGTFSHQVKYELGL